MVGTDYPFDMGDRTPHDTLAQQALSDADHNLVASETAARLLKLDL